LDTSAHLLEHGAGLLRDAFQQDRSLLQERMGLMKKLRTTAIHKSDVYR
jgi:hypothetical protein